MEEPLIVGFEPGLDYQTNIALIPQQLIEDNRISSDAAMFFIRAHYLMMSTRLPVYRESLLNFMPSMSDYKYRKVIKELEAVGYVTREQVRRFDNGRYGGVRYILSLPDFERETETLEEHLARNGYYKTPGQSRQLIFNTGDAPKGENQCFPSSSPSVDFQHRCPQTAHNPRSIPSVDFQHRPHITQPNVSPDLSTPSCSPKGSSSVAVNGSNEEMSFEKVDKSKGGVRLGSDGRPEGLRKALADTEGYQPSNCTVEEAVEVYEAVRKGCTDYRHYDDQLQMCLPEIDAMLESDDANWFPQLLQSIDFVTKNHAPKRYPSYWLKDYMHVVMAHARANVGFYRPPMDPVERERLLDELKANIEPRWR